MEWEYETLTLAENKVGWTQKLVGEYFGELFEILIGTQDQLPKIAVNVSQGREASYAFITLMGDRGSWYGERRKLELVFADAVRLPEEVSRLLRLLQRAIDDGTISEVDPPEDFNDGEAAAEGRLS